MSEKDTLADSTRREATLSRAADGAPRDEERTFDWARRSRSLED